ncbi:GGDEF domain-containing protein [Marinomonas sp. C1424]|uniref:diguanylate cyclase n=2 Tax=Marinomonas transparens TaxID=2795388 RepID=A0A934N3E9_9GAMM|nr:GGDEF domain-containing protein [Marinomonas transparens]
MFTELRSKDELPKSILLRFFYAGVSIDTLSDDIRRILVINLFAIVGVFFTFPLGVSSLLQGKTLLGLFLIFIALLCVVNYLILRYTHNHILSGGLIIYPLYILMLYLFYSGGVDGTGHTWMYCVPAIALFLNGMKRGLIEVGLFTLALVFIMFFSSAEFHAYDYPVSLKLRVLMSFFVVIFLSSIYEYSMSRYNEDLKDISQKLKLAAETDALTGLLNRRGMQQRLEVSTFNTIHLLLADVDYFKTVNDEYGHDVGDYVLSELSRLITESMPENSSASRWGGEEFLLAMCNVSGQEAYEFAEVLRKKVEAHEFVYAEFSFHITLSFGVATSADDVSLNKALKQADNRLYSAKRAGRNQTCRAEIKSPHVD